MGFFRWIKNKIGRVIEAIGDHLPLSVGIKICGIGHDMQDHYYDSSRSSINETVDFAAECRRACRDTTEQAAPVLQKMIDWCEQVRTKVRNDFQELMPDEALDDPYTRVDFEDIRSEYNDYIARMISMDNEEFLAIVKIPSKEEREPKVKEYTQKVVKDAAKYIMDYVEQKKNRAIEKMVDAVDYYIETSEADVQRKQAELLELQEKHDSPEHRTMVCCDKMIELAYLECMRSKTFSAKKV